MLARIGAAGQITKMGAAAQRSMFVVLAATVASEEWTCAVCLGAFFLLGDAFSARSSPARCGCDGFAQGNHWGFARQLEPTALGAHLTLPLQGAIFDVPLVDVENGGDGLVSIEHGKLIVC